MKIIYSLSGLLFCTTLFCQVLLPINISKNENYVFSRKYLTESSTSNISIAQAQVVNYFDGLGKSKQDIAINASTTGKDVVSHIEYDGFGRKVLEYLPVPQSGTLNGGFYPNPLANATNIFPVGEKIYSEKIIENSPLDRVRAQFQVGSEWVNNPILFRYDFNDANEVRKYETSTYWIDERTNTILLHSGFHAKETLYKSSIKDEDCNETIEFKNGDGGWIIFFRYRI